MPMLSIIVPVYNVEAYLPKCIDSILAQTITDFELILIDDGSPERCGGICDEYVAKDNRLIVLHQQNQGVSAARNAGLTIAKGEYIGFVDPDDYIESDMYQKMISVAEKCFSDIVICGVSYISESGEFLRSSLFDEAEFRGSNDLLSTLFMMPNPLAGSMCNKIFSRKVLQQGELFENQVSIGEDVIALFDIYKRSNTAIKIKDSFYNIRERENSASRIRSAKTIIERVNISKILLSRAKDCSKELKSRAIYKLLDELLLSAKEVQSISSIPIEEKKSVIWKFKKTLKRNVFRGFLCGLINKSQAHRFLYEIKST